LKVANAHVSSLAWQVAGDSSKLFFCQFHARNIEILQIKFK
jgi:hypothetical protein